MTKVKFLLTLILILSLLVCSCAEPPENMPSGQPQAPESGDVSGETPEMPPSETVPEEPSYLTLSDGAFAVCEPELSNLLFFKLHTPILDEYGITVTVKPYEHLPKTDADAHEIIIGTTDRKEATEALAAYYDKVLPDLDEELYIFIVTEKYIIFYATSDDAYTSGCAKFIELFVNDSGIRAEIGFEYCEFLNRTH